MKTFYLASMIVVVLVFNFCGCTSPQSDQLTQKQKEQVKSELQTVLDSFCVKWVALDEEAVLKFYSTDMVRVGKNKQLDFQAEKKIWDGVKDFSSAKIDPIHVDIIALSKNCAISTWVGNTEYLAKSGDTLKLKNQVYTNVFQKINGQWKIIYEHYSAFN